MSDFGNYYGSYESATELEANGNFLMAAIEYWMCIQYAEHGEFPVVPDTSLESKAHVKLRELQSKLPYAPLSKTSMRQLSHSMMFLRQSIFCTQRILAMLRMRLRAVLMSRMFIFTIVLSNIM